MSLPFWFDNLVAYSIQIALLVVVGGALPFLFRLRVPAVMLAYWQSLLVICLVLPAIQPWRQVVGSSLGSASNAAVRVQSVILAAEEERISFTIYEIMLLILAGGVAARLGWLALGLFRLERYKRDARLLTSLPEAVAEMQSRTGVQARVYISTEIESPVTFGMRHPVVLFPARFLEMEQSCQRPIACHELVHVRRQDWLYALAEELIGALFWFHPGMWWLLGRIQLSREEVVDRQVLRLTEARTPYLQALLHIARGKGRPEITLAPSFLTRHHLTRRVAMILTEVSMSKTRLSMSLFAICGLVLLMGRLAVWSFPLQAPAQEGKVGPEKPQRTPIRISGDIQAPKLIYRSSAVYPEEAKLKGLQATVALELAVNEKGQVWDARVLSGHPLLNNAALEAVRKWRFSPALQSGQPVPVLVNVEINFSLREDKKTGPTQPQMMPIRVGGNVLASKLLSQVQPVYPEEAKRQGIQGEVILHVTLNEKGEVFDVHPLRGHGLLNEAAIEAVRQWKYTTTLLNGEPVSVEATVTVVFKLNPDEPGPPKSPPQ